jgi:putative N6-adenine-specific DNA methylase
MGLSLNLFLKIPTRILLRLDNFKCKDFPKLYQRILKYKWNPFLGNFPKISSSSVKSRLFDSRKIEKAVLDGIKASFIRQPPKKSESYVQSLFVRLENDLCTLSLDTTGDPLFKRGLRTFVSRSPLRENLGAGLLYLLKKETPAQIQTLIDPMCGSGMFLLESQTFYQLADRDFSFKHFPIFKKLSMPALKNHRGGLFQIHRGFDRDESALKAAGENLKNLKDGDISFFQGDLFKIDPPQRPCCVILNPPYGIRLKLEDIPGRYFKNVVGRIWEIFRPETLGIILPADIKIKSFKKLRFKNGGLNVVFHLLKTADRTLTPPK